MAGGHVLGALRLGHVDEGGEFHQGVAPGAGEGGPPRQVLPVEVGADEVLQLVPDVHRPEGEGQAVRQGAGGFRAPQTDVQKDTDDVIVFPEQGGGHRGVHAAGQAQDQFWLHRYLHVKRGWVGADIIRPKAFPWGKVAVRRTDG